MKQECSDMLTTFFKELREIKKREKQQNKE